MSSVKKQAKLGLSKSVQTPPPVGQKSRTEDVVPPVKKKARIAKHAVGAFKMKPKSSKLELLTGDVYPNSFRTAERYHFAFKGVPIKLGTYKVSKEMSWKQVEDWVMENFHQLYKTSDDKNRHIDFQRKISSTNLYQSLEVKKAHGYCYYKPYLVRSGISQFNELLTYSGGPKDKGGKNVWPAAYVVVSVDFVKNKGLGDKPAWANTVWMLPVESSDDWEVFDFNRERGSNEGVRAMKVDQLYKAEAYEPKK